MLYMLAVLIPPLAFFFVGRPGQGLLSLLLMVTVIGWIPAAIWAVLVVNEHKSDKRTQRLIDAQRQD